MIEWSNIPEEITDDMVGFIYIIHNETNGKWYIGQKQFWSTKRLPPLKGKKRKRVVTKESDWRAYTGSSNALNSDIEKGDVITKKILHIGNSKWELNYIETLEQFSRNALISSDSYNGILNLRISKPPKSLDMVAFVETMEKILKNDN